MNAQEEQSKKKSGLQSWLAIAVTLLVVVFAYFTFLNFKENSANNNYYRILYEASNKFNGQLSTLAKIHESKYTQTSIRSLLPSYERKIHDPIEDVEKSYYHLSGQDLSVLTKEFTAQIDTSDILPIPEAGFSQFLFADEDGRVLATSGEEKNISLVKLDSVSQAFAKQTNKHLSGLLETDQNGNKKASAPKLPSYSSHIDMTLSYGEFRVFVFPFQATISLERNKPELGSIPQNSTGTVRDLYLVGLLPKAKLGKQGSGHWNVSMLVSSIVCVLFMWSLIRLYLLPKTHPITRFFRNATHVSSYAFFIVVIALTLAYLNKYVMQQSKDKHAFEYASQLHQALDKDLNQVFSRLQKYGDFYNTLLPLKDSMESLNEATLEASFKVALQKANEGNCQNLESNIPATAASPKATYDLGDCQNIDLKVDTGFLEAFKASQDPSKLGEETIDFFAKHLNVALKPNASLESSVKSLDNYQPSSLLNVFAMNSEGDASLPSFYFQENNVLPSSFNLSHRDYFKKVRDHEGWNVDFAGTRFNNVFIQRLHNISDGTRGTTISMPLEGSGHILGADVLLKSVTLAAPPPADFSFMLVDRNTGQVLFHNESDRAMVENIFYSGNSDNNLSRWIQAGLDQSQESHVIAGFYHGQKNRFTVHPAPLDHWAIVVFYPDDSLETLMANKFLFIALSFAVSLIFIAIVSLLLKYFVYTRELKRRLYLPFSFDTKEMINLCSIVLSMIYGLHAISHLLTLNLESEAMLAKYTSLLMPSASLIVVFFVGFGGYKKLFKATDKNFESFKQGITGAYVLALFMVILAATQLAYLSRMADVPLHTLNHHYEQLRCTQINAEKQELNKIGLSRYPNSITKERIAPVALLPLEASWKNTLQNPPAQCASLPSSVVPKDYPSLSSLVGDTLMWQWVEQHILRAGKIQNESLTYVAQGGLSLSAMLFTLILLALLIWGWMHFNRHLLWHRLYYSQYFIKHVQRISHSVHALIPEQPDVRLRITIDTPKLNGVDLATLQRVCHQKKQTAHGIEQGFPALYDISPLLREYCDKQTYFPGVKIQVSLDANDKVQDIELWHLDATLRSTSLRPALLAFITELKSLTLRNKIGSMHLYSGFFSLQRVKSQDVVSIDDKESEDIAPPSPTELLKWSECLIDFSVELPESLHEQLNMDLLQEEANAMPELAFLLNEREGEYQPEKEKVRTLLRPRKWQIYTDEWATLNYVLLNVTSVYRYKWESCSQHEKLALYHLAKRQTLNPAHTDMIERLALNGLIKVKNYKLDLVSKSFRHFILHAETKETLAKWVSNGEGGRWRQYRLPVGLLVVLVIGGIALTSGESIYVIAASLAGLVGTIASVANSANLLKGQLKE